MRNRATERYQVMMDRLTDTNLNDDEAVEMWFDDFIALGFVRRDRRSLIGVPEASREDFVGQITSWGSVEEEQPTFTIAEVFDVRGDRLLLCRLSISFPDGMQSGMVQVLLFDDAVERVDRMTSFDYDHVAAARAELDRMNAEVGRDDM